MAIAHTVWEYEKNVTYINSLKKVDLKITYSQLFDKSLTLNVFVAVHFQKYHKNIM